MLGIPGVGQACPLGLVQIVFLLELDVRQWNLDWILKGFRIKVQETDLPRAPGKVGCDNAFQDATRQSGC